MRAILLSFSSVIAGFAYLVYALSILRGKAKPHRTTRFVVLLIEILTTVTLYAHGDRTAIWLSSAYVFSSLIIFILSIKKGMGGWGKVDALCLAAAFAGIIIWKLTNNPLLGLYFSIIADFFGVIPTFIKTYTYPKTEVWSFYGIGLVAVVLNMMAIDTWTVGEYIYPVYIALVNIVMIILIFRKENA